mgnify:CR=1 FL=1
MPVYQLDKRLWFPEEDEYEEHGVVAVGGDLSIPRLILAYQMGIFPWYNPDEPITWWSPEKRMVLKPNEVKISKSSRNLLNRNIFEIKFDTAFEEVLNQCQNIKRKDQDGTWLNEDLKASILDLHKLGLAHSVECWKEGKLVGGLYGISLGKMFFGESMFSKESNASKMAFIGLCQKLESLNFNLLDCQIYNAHLESLGAYEIERSRFLKVVRSNDLESTIKGRWENV